MGTCQFPPRGDGVLCSVPLSGRDVQYSTTVRKYSALPDSTLVPAAHELSSAINGSPSQIKISPRMLAAARNRFQLSTHPAPF